MTSKVIEATEGTFESVVMSSPVPVLVDFWAPWCRPCRAVTPAMEEIAEKHSAWMRVVKINLDHNPGLATRFAIRAIPTVLLVAGGQVLRTLVGVRPKEEYERLVQDTQRARTDSGSFLIQRFAGAASEVAPG